MTSRAAPFTLPATKPPSWTKSSLPGRFSPPIPIDDQADPPAEPAGTTMVMADFALPLKFSPAAALAMSSTAFAPSCFDTPVRLEIVADEHDEITGLDLARA